MDNAPYPFRTLYRPEDVAPEFHPIFQQLLTEFGNTFEVWRQVSDFGTILKAGVVNPTTQVTATILLKSRVGNRTKPLTHSDVEKINHHLSTRRKNVLAL